MGDLATRLERAMRSADMDAVQLADKAGLSKQTVYNILNGTTRADTLRASTLFSICNALGTDPIYMLTARAPVPSGSQHTIATRDMLAEAVEFLEGFLAGSERSANKVSDPDYLVAAIEIIQARQAGTPLAEAFRRLAARIRQIEETRDESTDHHGTGNTRRPVRGTPKA